MVRILFWFFVIYGFTLCYLEVGDYLFLLHLKLPYCSPKENYSFVIVLAVVFWGIFSRIWDMYVLLKALWAYLLLISSIYSFKFGVFDAWTRHLFGYGSLRFKRERIAFLWTISSVSCCFWNRFRRRGRRISGGYSGEAGEALFT